MHKTLWIFLGILTAFLSGCGNDSHKSASTTSSHHPSLSNNELTLQFVDSNETATLLKKSSGIVLKNDPERLLLIDIFATWCPPCKAEMPVLSDLQKQFPDKLLVIGVSIEENISPKELLRFKQENHATYKIVSPSSAEELIGTVVQQTHMGKRFAIPLMALYKDGKLLHYYAGATEEEFLLSDIKQALGK